MRDAGDFRVRIDALRERVDMAAVVGAAVKLSRGRNPRGKCPFHGSKSDSFAVYSDRGTARCWGCGWSGDAIRFVQDHYGIGFAEALGRLEADHELDGLSAAPLARAKRPRDAKGGPGEPVSSAELGRHIWQQATADLEAVRTYLSARGVPAAMLAAERLADLRFAAHAPIVPWRANLAPDTVPRAPAIAALIRSPAGAFAPIGVHVTFLGPDLRSKMVRRRGDGSLYPARKMLGASGGGCVVLPGAGSSAEWIDGLCALFVGEGLETALSGMAVAGAGETATGLAVLSLDSLQGHPALCANGALPLFEIRPDAERGQAVAFAHDGPVTGLIDADMKPLRGPIDRTSGEPRGIKLVERRGARVVRRALTTAERAAIAGELFVRAWRAAGCRQVRAVRPRMGLDFNDAVREQHPGDAARNGMTREAVL